MTSRIPEPKRDTPVKDYDKLPPLPEPISLSDNEVDVQGQVRYGNGKQTWWLRVWIHILVLWALWFMFIGAQGLYKVEDWVNYLFGGVIIFWTVYHLIAPRFKWPALPLG